MRIEWKGVIVLMLLIIGIVGFASSNEESKIDKKIIEEFKDKDKVKVIVSLKEIKQDKKGISAQSNNGRKIEAKEISFEEIKKLAEKNEVERIEYNYPVKAFLESSVPLINASSSWSKQVNGINLTGLNQAVCIIDTGVNYTHPDLGGCYGNNNASSGCKVIGGYDFFNNDNDPMDDHGHGTHVAGIVSANETIRGVAPNVKIIAIKALNSDGGGLMNDVRRGIDWCVGNATVYNISVISLSLGTTVTYSDYCDSSSTELASSINSAVSNNISVVVATGNDGSSTHISSPACIQNAIPVTASTKADGIASYANRNSLVQIIAPGSNINSTGGPFSSECTKNGNYMTCSGTSMATPHVAGTIAIMNQFMKITGQNKTPSEIESVLNNTGKKIFDSSSSLYYSRINLYNALSQMAFNNISLLSPANGLHTNTNQSFSCNVSSNTNLSNINFQIWNYTGLENSTINYVTGLSNSSTLSYGFKNEGNYIWTCLATTNSSLEYYSLSNFSITYDVTRPGVNITLPVNGSWSNGAFSLAMNENGTCNYSLNSGIANISMSSQNNRTFNASNNTLIQTENYTINYFCTDGAGNKNLTSLASFQADFIFPVVSSISPDDGYSDTSSQSSITFTYNVTDNLNISNCSLIVNGAIDQNDSSVTNQSATHSFSKTISSGSYTWGVNCSDIAGNIANSSTRSITITAPSGGVSSSGGGGGGGGGSSAIVYLPSISETENGYTKEVKKDDKIEITIFDVQSQKHTISVEKVGTDFVNLTVRSEPIRVMLGIGQGIKLNLTSSREYNLYIKLENIVNGKAIITVQTINEPIVVVEEKPSEDNLQTDIPEDKTPVQASETNSEKIDWTKFKLVNVLVAIVVGIIVGFLVHWWDLRKKKKAKMHSQK